MTTYTLILIFMSYNGSIATTQLTNVKSNAECERLGTGIGKAVADSKNAITSAQYVCVKIEK